jgi:aryl-alcohol dehydrogenase-like predicted oxidoreductase
MTIKRRKIGTTKLHVTELGLGGAPMGGYVRPLSRKVVLAD